MLMNSGAVSQNLNCRAAPLRSDKRAIKTNEKIDQEKQPPTYKSTTHTMLQCCVSVLIGKAQKTAIYARRPISSRPCKAHFGCATPYSSLLETTYFNNLRSRTIDRLQMVRGR
jgi:hypothetical protein